ncbi:MAG: c-type cytochrome [Rhodobacteraceae bacterium]|nr:c-type cytochrome [Paracoccaceae bacterium]
MRWCLAAALWLAGAIAPAAQDFTTLKGHGGPIMALAVAPDGRVVSASFDNSVGLWQGRTPTWLEGHDAAVTALALGSDGTLVSGGDDFAIRLWGAEPRELGRHLGKVTALAVAPGGDWVASGSWDGSLRLWPLAEGAAARDLPAPGAGVNAVAYGPDGAAIYAATTDGNILRYATDGSALRVIVKNGFPVNKLVIGPGWIAYGAADGVTRVIEIETGAPIADFTLDRRPILAMAHHPATGQLAVGDGHGYIMMIDTATWTIARDFRAARTGPVWALAFSPDGTVIHAGGIDDVIYSWPVAMLDRFDPAMGQERSFLRPAETMPNGERQFMRKCSICHSLEPGPSRQAGPTLYGVFGRPAGAVPGYPYSPVLAGSDLVWTDETIDALFDIGPDHYIPGSKMPMQVIAGADDRADLVAFLKQATKGE